MPITQVLEHSDMIGTVVAAIPGSEIERRRSLLGWSQKDLAARARVSGRTVYAAETGEVSDKSYLRIMEAIEAGEDERKREAEPELFTLRQTIEGPDGPVTVTIVGKREAVRRLNMGALMDPLFTDE